MKTSKDCFKATSYGDRRMQTEQGTVNPPGPTARPAATPDTPGCAVPQRTRTPRPPACDERGHGTTVPRPPPSSRRLDSTAPPAAWHSEMSLFSVRIRIRSPPARCDRNPVPLSRCICRSSWVTLLGVEIQIPRSGSRRLPSWDVSEPPPAWVANGRERQTLGPVQGWGFFVVFGSVLGQDTGLAAHPTGDTQHWSPQVYVAQSHSLTRVQNDVFCIMRHSNRIL